MSKLEVKYSKTLKVINPVFVKIDIEEIENLGIVIDKLENYIRSKGFHPIGPIIQKIEPDTTKSGISITIYRQSSGEIKYPIQPYSVAPMLRVTDCLYVRFSGRHDELQFAYNKLNLVAYEEEILLEGSQYSVFLEQTDEYVLADIFMPKEKII